MKTVLAVLMTVLLASCGGGGATTSVPNPQRLVQVEFVSGGYTKSVNSSTHGCAEGWVFNFDLGEYALIELCVKSGSTVAKAFAEVGKFSDYSTHTSLDKRRTTCDNLGITLTRSVDRNLQFRNNGNGTANIYESGTDIGAFDVTAYYASITAIDWGCFTSDGGFTKNETADAELARLGL